jgi:rRNA maturation endonuclease Nob1
MIMIPIKRYGNWACTNCGQFFLDKNWLYCPICGSQIHWAQADFNEAVKKYKGERK